MTPTTKTVTIRLDEQTYTAWETLGKAEGETPGVAIKNYVSKYVALTDRPHSSVGDTRIEDMQRLLAAMHGDLQAVRTAVLRPGLPVELDMGKLRELLRPIEIRLDDAGDEQKCLIDYVKVLRLNLARSVEKILLNVTDDDREVIISQVEELFNAS